MPKSKLHTDPNILSLHQSEENERPRSRWEKWVAKNALPKNHHFPKPKSQPTRFQKPGPMSCRDEKRFLRWAMKRSLPKQIVPEQKVTIPTRKIRFKQRKTKTLASIMCRLKCLSVPKKPRQKYVPPPRPSYPFSPKIHYRKPPHRDRGRPFENVQLPNWWYHEELEMDFWRWMRFPVSRCALKYKATCNTNMMAIPKSYPIKPHCPYPPRDYSPPDRVKMTPRQWRGHLKRLDYLADARFKANRQNKVKI